MKLDKVALSLALALSSAQAPASLIFDVTYSDPGNLFSGFYQSLTADIQAAGALWSSQILGSASLQVVVSFGDIATANGSSVTSNFVRTIGGLSVFEQGAASEIRTGIDPNGAAPDIRFTIGKTYLQNELWLDPIRTTPVPINKTDAVSVFTHELGHALAFNGFLDGMTGANFGVLSTYDEWVSFVGGNLYFNGPHGEDVYGGPVPLTFGNYSHVGNAAPRPGSELVPVDLMNGVAFSRGTHYDISRLDLAFLSDVGIGLLFTVPEPGTLALLALGLSGLVWKRPRGLRQNRQN